jgi:hypothetical protein
MNANAKWLGTATLTGLLLLLPGRSVDAFSWYQYGGYDLVWAGAHADRFMSPSTFPEGSETDVLYRNAMALWMMVPSATFTYAYGYYEPQQIDNFDGYSDTLAVPQGTLDPGVLAVTYMVNNGAEWFDMDMLFCEAAAGYMWSFSANPTCEEIRDPAANGISFLLVSTHELGHALGLGHDPVGNEPPGSAWFIGTMNPTYPDGGPVGDQAIIEVHADDRNGTRYLYPHSGQSQTVVDLANPGYATGPIVGMAVPATISPTAAHPGDTVTLTSVIENFGNSNVFNVSQGFYLSTDATVTTNDESLGSLFWDLAMGDGFQFGVDVDLADDMATGEYWFGSILDDLNQVTEEFEDNNTHVYCDTLTILQLEPVINDLGQDIASCGTTYYSPAPTVTHPLNMAPLTWSLDNPEPGMTINPSTGVIHWPKPVRSSFPYVLIVRATNDAGTSTQLFFLGVEQQLPAIVPIADQYAAPGAAYTGPGPQLTEPDCMNPVLNWSLDTAPAGMDIDHATGVVTWPDPTYAGSPHEVTIRATNAIGNGTVSWHLTVGTPGDMNCDGTVDFADINPFVEALIDPDAYNAAYECYMNADIDQDGVVDFADINPFVALLTGG